MVIYEGIRDQRGIGYVARCDGDQVEDLALRLDLRRHSPDGPEWGYGGSGPAQLALALLADALGDQVALSAYQVFKWAVVARLNREGFRLTRDAVRLWWEAKDKRTRDCWQSHTASPADAIDDGIGIDLHEPL